MSASESDSALKGGFALNNKISLRQMQALIFLEIFGFGVTALPRRVAEHAGQDGWFGVLMALLAALILVWVFTAIIRMFPGVSFYDFVTRILSRPVGIVVCLIFCARLIILAAFYLRIFAEITQSIMLPTTPFIVIFAAMLGLAAYGASKGIEARARLAEVLFLVVLLPLIFVFGISGKDIDFSNLQPVLITSSLEDLFGAANSAFFAFNGIEMLLLISPFLSLRPANGRANGGFAARRASATVILSMGIFMAVITAVTIARFGPQNVTAYDWPVLKMMDTVSLPGSIIDRQGALIMTFWIISAYAIINAALFFSSLLLKDVVKKGKHSYYILFCVPIIAVIANVPQNLNQLYEYFNLYNNTFGIVTMVILPLTLLIVAKIRRKIRKGDNNHA